MTSKDDDTLPLPGLSEGFSADASVDEDFIPTSQPQSSGSPKTSISKPTEELKCISDSRIDDTLPPEAVMNQSEFDRDKSTDFIPDTETKKPKISYGNAEVSCKKKLPVFGAEDIFKLQSNPLWESEMSKIPESPALEMQNISILNDTPEIKMAQEEAGKCEESITEIIVNDSAETVDLEATPIKIKSSDSEKPVEKFEISCSSASFGERCEETQIFDNSSVLLLDQPGGDCVDLEKSERVSGVTSEKLYLQETVLESPKKSEGNVNGFGSVSSPPFAVGEVAEKADATENTADFSAKNVFPKQEVQQNSTSLEPNNAYIVTRKIDFKLTVSCFVTINTKTNKVLQKIILNVNETPKPKPKPAYVEPVSDNTSDKSKRYSTSSSGSVYSDKMGPFALPKRVSAISDQTDSSEDEFGSLLIKERRALERVPWSNEYLLPLKMDDIMLLSIENQELLKRPNITSSPRKLKNRCNGVSHLSEILESSTSEQTTSDRHLGSVEVQSSRTSPRELTNSEEAVGKETPDSSEPQEEEKPLEENPNGSLQKEESPQNGDKPEESEAVETEKKEEEELEKEEESSSTSLRDGLPVFARWAWDKRYYSGVLCGSVKNDRWEVKFDDGTSKSVREEFIMPATWLTVGALVFAMADENYLSGQIVDVRKGEEIEYLVELDAENRQVSVKISDLCLTEVMAGIVKEKYKPLIATPRGKADIDCDNVLSGKRIREQRTPLRPPSGPTGNSGPKKKSSSSKPKKDEGLQSIKENTGKDDTGKKRGGLKTENGHLVEDKVISADSPSGTETGETPLRRGEKDTRKKGKPRSLSYEAEEARGKKKLSSWLAPDGTPIPGPSGVKFKKQKTKTKTEEAEESDSDGEPPAVASKSKKSPGKAKSVQEKSRRKRKLDESCIDDSVLKKPLKEDENRMKTRTRRG